jgi:hypothetical protein
MWNNVEEAWVRLEDAEHPPTQEEKDTALRWTLQFPKRKSMTVLLEQHGADRARVERAYALDELPILMDGVVQAEHRQSVRHVPKAANVLAAVPAHRRGEVISWVSLACNAINLNSLIAGVVLTLDRFYAAQTKPIDDANLHHLTLAALCTEMKLANGDSCPQAYREQVLLHLGQGRASLRSILQTEARMLAELQYSMGISTPMSFLESLVHHLRKGFEELANVTASSYGSHGKSRADSEVLYGTGFFLTDLAMYDVELMYRYHHSLLASAALGVALLCKGPNKIFSSVDSSIDAECTAGLHAVLAADLESRCGSNAQQLRDCEEELLGLWSGCAKGTSPWSDCYARACAKYSSKAGWPDKERNAAADLEGGLVRFHILYAGAK